MAVSAVWMVARSEMRRRWGSIAVLTVLVGLVGIVVVASVAGARRTGSSMDRFEEYTRSADVEINAGETTPEQLREFRSVKGVAEVAVLRQLALFQEDVDTFLAIAGQVDNAFGTRVDRARLVEGRRAHRADELTIGETLADALGISVGDRVRFKSYSPEQIIEDLLDDEALGPSVAFRVVGIVRRPLDLGGRGTSGGVVVPTRAFVRERGDEIGSFSGNVLRVRTENGEADIPHVVREARRIFDNENFSGLSLAIEGQSARNAIDVAATALWVLAAVAAIAGLVAIAIALARHLAYSTPGQDALRSLGLRPIQRWAATTLGAVPIAIGGALITVVGATIASPLFPIGVARKAEPDLGLAVDWFMISAGFAAVFTLTLALGGLAAIGAIRRKRVASSKPGLVTTSMWRAAAPPAVATGVASALEREPARGGVPIGATLAGAAFGVLAAVAALTFAASLDRLVTTPGLYGWSFDYLTFDADQAGDDPIACGRFTTRATEEPLIGGVSELCTQPVEVEGHPVNAMAFVPFKGSVGPTIVDGRAPRGPREVALGADTLDSTGKRIGDSVSVAGEAGTFRFRVVGTTLGISLDDPAPLADTATFARAAMNRLGEGFNGVLAIQFASGADHGEATRFLRELAGGEEPAEPVVPAEVDRIRQVDFLPVLLAGFVVLVALVAVGYALVISVRRRQRDLAILKTLGFDRRQVRASVAWQASTLAAVGLVVGIPLGFLAGSAAWNLVADDLGVPSGAAVPVLAVLAVVPVAVLLANLIAAFPARAAARTSPAVVLRSE